MSREYSQISISAAGSNDQTAVYLWEQSSRPRAVVQIVHGMCEHMERYDGFARFLTAQGYAVCGHDHMGHGKSGSMESVFGHFGESGGPRRLLDDCKSVTRLIQRNYPDTPIFLLGHSMGSFIGRLYILRHADEIAGFLCMGTGGEDRRVPYARTVAEAMVRLRGASGEGRALHALTFRGFNERLSLEVSRMAWLSRDAQAVADYEADPLIGDCLTNAGFRDLFDLQMAATSARWAKEVDKSLPILLASGAEDPVGNYGRGVVQVYERLKLAGALHVQCKLYEGARHELLHEINREEVFYDLYRWMEDILH